MATTNNGLEDYSVDPIMLSDIPSLDFDDSVAFGDALNLDLDNDSIFSAAQDNNWNYFPTPPERGLYSTPLSWDPPKTHVDPVPEPPRSEVNHSIFRPAMNTLTIAQQEKLRSIAMPEHLQFNLHRRSPQSTSSTRKSGSPSSPDQIDVQTRKRKSSADDDDDEDDEHDENHPPVKKTAHNMIEKRYRTNLNDKIAALRDSVPSLRVMSKNAKGEDTTADREDLQGLTPAHKLNKATVLSKATEYIRHLEKRNKRLQDESAVMKQRIMAFEKLFMSGSMGMDPVQSPMTYGYRPPDAYTSPNGQITPGVSPQGMIDVPEDIRRMNAQTMQRNQQIYQVQEQHQQLQQHQHQQPQQPYPGMPQPPHQAQQAWAGNGYFGKMMLGSLAVMMVLEGFDEPEQDGEEPSARGLFSFPVQLLRGLHQSLRSSTGFNALGYQSSADQTLTALKMVLIFGVLLSVFLPSVFSKPAASTSGKTSTASLSAAPSLASPIQVRRQAWLTAIQTVWVPRHNFFLEATALFIKMAKLSLRNAVGWYGYAVLTGITEQQEAARVKAWAIALDAQLGGGDIEISKSRLTLTLLASGTLPDTPARLMMKALHIRVLLWELGNSGANGYYMFHEVAAKLARWKWNEARQLQRLISHAHHLLTKDDPDLEPLPSHLVALLNQECDDVLVDRIGQRAHNLAWNKATTHGVSGPSDGMDSVVSDFSISSPLDAVAAWFSSMTLHEALSLSLATESDPVDVVSKIKLAIETAPIGSAAQARALVAQAVVLDEKKGANIAAALQVLQTPAGNDDESTSLYINSTLSLALVPDLKMALICATAVAHLERDSTSISNKASTLIQSIKLPTLSLLGFTAAYRLMTTMMKIQKLDKNHEHVLENLAGTLRIWIGGRDGISMGLEKGTIEVIVETCVGVSKRCMGFTVEDDGYESMSPGEEADGDC